MLPDEAQQFRERDLPGRIVLELHVVHQTHHRRREHRTVQFLRQFLLESGGHRLNLTGHFRTGVLAAHHGRIGIDGLDSLILQQAVGKGGNGRFRSSRVNHHKGVVLRKDGIDLRLPLHREGYVRLLRLEEGEEKEDYRSTGQRNLVPCHHTAYPVGRQHEGLLARVHHSLLENHQEGRQYGKGAYKAENHTLGEHHTHIHTNLEPHEHEHHKSHDRGRGAAHYGREGAFDCTVDRFHRAVLPGLLLAVTVHQDYGIVQRKHHLQYGHYVIRGNGYAWKQGIGAYVHHYGQTGRNQENQRFQPGLGHGYQDYEDEGRGNYHHRCRRCVAVLAGLHDYVILEAGGNLLSQQLLIDTVRHIQLEKHILSVLREAVADRLDLGEGGKGVRDSLYA